MANRKPSARHADHYIAVYLSKEEALSEDRDGLVSIQNFEHTLNGLDGLEALDSENDFEDGDVIEIPCFIRVCQRKQRKAPKGRKVGVVRQGEATTATEAPAEDMPF